MKAKKPVFWLGLAVTLVGLFGLFGHAVGGDALITVGLAIMVSSFAFELLTLFFICAAFFWFQVFDYEMVTVAILGISAIVSAALSLWNKV